LETEVLNTPNQALSLIEELYEGTKEAVQRRLAQLKEALGSDGPVEKWQMEYAKQKLIRKKTSGFAPQDARQYFQVRKVIPGLLRFAENFYGIHLKERLDVRTWHESVLVYNVYDDEGEKDLIGRIYLDFLFREDKENHPCSLGLTSGVDGKQYAEAVLVVGLEGEPDATMSYWDTSACWHELGHLFHQILGGKNQRYHRFSGFSVPYDFIEAPSQLAEEWLEVPAVIKSIAVNAKGEEISDSMLQNLIKSEESVKVLLTCQRLLWCRIAVSRRSCSGRRPLILFSAADVPRRDCSGETPGGCLERG
jgi:thimet oligopeptidase